MDLKLILESLLFSAQKPLTAAELRQAFATAAAAEGANETERAFKKIKAADIETALEDLVRDHEQAQRSYRLVCVAGAWQFATTPEFAPWLRAFVGERNRPARLSQPALETLAIISYRQPLTRTEIEQIRGVSVDGVMQTLLERGLIEQTGRAEVAGRPAIYGTTPAFLEYFGLRSLADLPAADELRRIPVERPPSLVTTEPGLATSPPEQLTLEQVENPGNASAESAEPKPDPRAPAAEDSTSP